MSLPERGRLHHECIGAVSCLSSEHPLGPLALPGTSRLCLPSGVSWGESKPRVRPEPQTPGSGSRRAASTARSGPAAHWNPAPNHFWAASRRLRSTRAASSQRGQPRKSPCVLSARPCGQGAPAASPLPGMPNLWSCGAGGKSARWAGAWLAAWPDSPAASRSHGEAVLTHLAPSWGVPTALGPGTKGEPQGTEGGTERWFRPGPAPGSLRARVTDIGESVSHAAS